jgi:hypothetical protein
MSASTSPPVGPPVPAAHARPQPLYFINGPADFLLAGGLSILTFAAFYFFLGNSHKGRSGSVIGLGQQLLWVCNWPHFAATSYRLYHSRENIRQYPLTALGIPWLILAAVIGSIAYPEAIAPYFVMIFLLWSPYHFSGQTVGVTMIYARRAGFFVGAAERFALSSFVFATFLCQTINSQINPATFDYYGIKYPSLGLPLWMWLLCKDWMYLMAILFALLFIRQSLQKRRLIPPIILLPPVTQFVWFVLSAEWPSFNEFVPFFHSLQYLLIAWSMQLKEKLDREQARPSASRAPIFKQARLAMLIVLGVCVYPFVAWLLSYDAQIPENLKPALPAVITGVYIAYVGFSYAMESYQLRPSYGYLIYESMRWFDLNILFGACLFFVAPILLSHFFNVNKYLAIGVAAAAVQVHHFFVDGVIWKLKRATVSSPLMVNISDLIAPSQAQPIPVIASTPAVLSSERA